MTFNLPMAVKDHAPPTVAKIDEEIDRLLERVALLMQQRAVLDAHVRVQQALERPLPELVGKR